MKYYWISPSKELTEIGESRYNSYTVTNEQDFGKHIEYMGEDFKVGMDIEVSEEEILSKIEKL